MPGLDAGGLSGSPDRKANGKAEMESAGTGETTSLPSLADTGTAIPDPASLRTLAEVHRAQRLLSSHSNHLDLHLDNLLSRSGAVVSSSLDRVTALAPSVDEVMDEAKGLDGRLKDTAKVAERISERVRRLDEEQSRVKKALDMLGKVQDLKSSLLALNAAMEQQGWEAATRHCSRAMSIDKDVLESKFAESVVPTTDLPLSPSQTLSKLRSQLLDIFTRRFRTASAALDEASTSRFFRFFPLIGYHKEGLEEYCTWARGSVRERGGRAVSGGILGREKATSPHHYASLLTVLLESLALLIDQHQPVVDKFYGLGGFRDGVMGGLQEECDRIAHRVLEAWEEEREVKRTLAAIKKHRFALSSAVSQPSFPRNRLPRGGVSNPNSGRSTPVNLSTPGEDGDGLDAREADKLLGELASMGGRWGTYRKFLEARLTVMQDTRPDAEQEADVQRSTESEPPPSGKPLATPSPVGANVSKDESGDAEQRESEELKVLTESAFARELAQELQDVYEPMEVWYLRISIEKAHSIDTPDTATQPYTSSVLDDVFYLLRSVLTRIVSTSSLPTLLTMVRRVTKAMEDDYAGVLLRRMEAAWRGVSNQGAGAASGGGIGGAKDAALKEARTLNIIYLNDLSTSADYMERLVQEILGSDIIGRSLLDFEIPQAVESIQSLDGLASVFRSVCRAELQHLFDQLLRPRLRPVLSEAYRDVSYILDEDAFEQAEYQDVLRRRLIKGWEAALEAYKGPMTTANFETMFDMGVEMLIRPWEKMVMGMRFNELGAIRFDKDIRNVATYLSSQTTRSVREKFTRLQQMSILLNLDSSEDGEEFYQTGSDNISWRLSAREAKAVLELRI